MFLLFSIVFVFIVIVGTIVATNVQEKKEAQNKIESNQKEGWKAINKDVYIKEDENKIKLNNSIFDFDEIQKCSIYERTTKEQVENAKGMFEMLNGAIHEFCQDLRVDVQTSNINNPLVQIVIYKGSINKSFEKYNKLMTEAKRIEASINAIITTHNKP